MEPIPETAEAIESLGPSFEGGRLLADLARQASHAKEIVPDLVGVSIASLNDGLTFTLATSN